MKVERTLTVLRMIPFLIVVCLVSLPAYAKYSGGSGTAHGPYQIATAADLIALGETPGDYDKHFILTADIDLDPNLPGRKVFDKAVIAPDTNGYQGVSFTGIFDGNGRIISNLTIRGGGYLGLFGKLGTWDTGGQVKNLGVVDVNITSSGWHVGGLVGWNHGNVTRCYSTGVVNGGEHVGGLVGINNTGGTVTQCYSTGAISGWSYVGGLVGYNVDGEVTQCYSTGIVNGHVTSRGLVGSGIGGLVGSGGLGVLNSVWDVESSDLSASDGGVGLTTAEMRDPYMLGLNGFGEDPNWVLDAGRDYPRLAWEGKAGYTIPKPKIDWLAGQGTAENPHRIETAVQLILLGKASILCDKQFVLGADIDLDAALPDRRIFSGAVIPAFTGVFDGNSHTISHLTIKGKATDRLGLFGRLQGEIKNLGVVDADIVGSGDYVGGLVGYNDDGAATKCYSTGSVNGNSYVGGLMGWNGGTVAQCYSTVAVSGDGRTPGWSGVGGLVGYNDGALTDCHSTGVVSGNECIGGLVGFNWADVAGCYSTGAVRGSRDVGGLVGYNGGCATSCYSTSVVTGMSDVGGLIGRNGLYNGDATWLGHVTACYSTGAVSGNDGVGGLVGYNWGGPVTQCYSIGAVKGNSKVGGLVGSGGGATASFWDIQTSGQTTSAAGTGATTARMQTAKTFLDAGVGLRK